MESTKIKPERNDGMTGEQQPENPEVANTPARVPARSPKSSPAPAPPGVGDTPGYFHIYKKGQGYWTRIGTVAGASILGLLTMNFLYWEIDTISTGPKISKFLGGIHLQQPRAAYLLVLIFAIAYAMIAYHMMNKPTNVDFLIATDSEMKKVNWTTRKELIGSTKVVIGFMFVIAILLLAYDLFFQMVFYLLGVLKTPPFFMGH
jgi:preprotein translocase subunit SecE